MGLAGHPEIARLFTNMYWWFVAREICVWRLGRAVFLASRESTVRAYFRPQAATIAGLYDRVLAKIYARHAVWSAPRNLREIMIARNKSQHPSFHSIKTAIKLNTSIPPNTEIYIYITYILYLFLFHEWKQK